MTGIVLLNLGGPKDQKNVESFLYELFSDRNIFKLPFQKLSAYLISKFRSPSIKKLYAQIGGGSPILEETYKQAEALNALLNSEKKSFKVYVGMQYTPPFIEETLDLIIKDKIKRVLFLPLYPQYSVSTTYSSFERIKKYIKKTPSFPKYYQFIHEWYAFDPYIESLVYLILKKIKTMKYQKELHLLFSAHSIPEYMVKNGDPYQKQIKITIEKVIHRLKKFHQVEYPHILCYQSKVGPIKWLTPSTEESIQNIAKKKPKVSLLVIPISFVSDHFEILYEIDILYREEAKMANIQEFERIDSLNTEKCFIECLQKIILLFMKLF